MAILKCKMCGGNLIIEPGSSVCECDSCGSMQTIPKGDDEKKITLFGRANRLRSACEFDKAFGVYESIVAEYPDESEAYWGLVLCKYGIEYVDDPATGKKIPTCHRSSFDSVMSDTDLEQALENADAIARKVYREEAKTIEELRKGIIEVSGKEEPYDIFICYKETAPDGQRTLDSVMAQDIYEALTNRGYRVFFSRITLEDKLGQEYEPFIFAALNSAKIMLAFGTDYEYFNAVWVKNEWSRYLKLMAADKTKHLIPCYKNIDAYDMPPEFAKLQAQDLGKVGADQDLIRGIEKILGKRTLEPQSASGAVSAQQGKDSGMEALVKRGNMALEDGEWQKADAFFEEVLNKNAECAEAYLGKFLAKHHRNNLEKLVTFFREKETGDKSVTLNACHLDNTYVGKMKSQYAIEDFLSKEEIEKQYEYNLSYSSVLTCRIEQKRKIQAELESDKLFVRAKQYGSGETLRAVKEAEEAILRYYEDRVQTARAEDDAKIAGVKAAYELHKKKADEKVKELYETADAGRAEKYKKLEQKLEEAQKIADYERLQKEFQKMRGYQSADQYAARCEQTIADLKKQQADEEERQKAAAKKRSLIMTIAVCVAVLAAIVGGTFYFLNENVFVPNRLYQEAMAQKESGQYEKAIASFKGMPGYKDSGDQVAECTYFLAMAYKDAGQYEKAIAELRALENYADSRDQIVECTYWIGVDLMNAGQYEDAISTFKAVAEFPDSNARIQECRDSIKGGIYQEALACKESGDYEGAIAIFQKIIEFRDAEDQIQACETAIKDAEYDRIMELKNSGKYMDAYKAFMDMNYRDSAEQAAECQISMLASAVVDDYVNVGNLDWKVLEKNGNSLLLMTRRAVENVSYHEKLESVTWENCSLRKYLNGDYMENQFTEQEKLWIKETSVKAGKNPDYRTTAGNNTTDKLFILSVEEVEKYFPDASTRKCLGPSGNSGWWLRVPGEENNRAAVVQDGGSLNKAGGFVNLKTGVRPVMWIELPSK